MIWPEEVEEAAKDPRNFFGRNAEGTPRYIKVRVLGRGGMGIVWLAYETALTRYVALKFLQQFHEEDLQRFRQEAQISAAIQHPNIAGVYAVGELEGQVFISMQFVDGRPIGQEKMSVADAAGAIRDIARAIQVAHDKGVIHRDIKPGNILRREDGTPVLTDFGLAKKLATPTKLSVTGMIIGTPSYMSPEQARGIRDVDHQSDVYGLGATLYTLVTGRAPFESDEMVDVLMAVLDKEPKRPKALQPGIHEDLDTIIMKCLEKDRQRRYKTAHALAEDLQRFLDHEPILAKPSSVFSRIFRRIRKNRRVWGGAAVASAVGLIVAGVLFYQLREKVREDEKRVEARPFLEQARDRIENLRALSRSPIATRADLSRRAEQARIPLHKAIEIDPENAESHQLLARSYMEVDAYSKARDPIDRAVARAPEDPSIRLDRARILIMLHEDEVEIPSIVVSMSGVVDVHPPKSSALAIELMREVEEDLRIAEKQATSAKELHLTRGWVAMQKNEFEEADRHFGKAIDELPLDAVAWHHRALIRLYTNRLEDARADIETAVRLRPLYPEPRILLGQILAGQNRPAEAEKAFKMAREITGEKWKADVSLGVLYNQTGRFKEALEKFNLALEAWPDFAHALGGRANAYSMLKRYPEAMADYERVLELDPKNAMNWYNRGQCLGYQNRIDEAIDDFTKAIELNPQYVVAYANRSFAYTLKKKFEEALADINTVLELRAEIARAWMQRGQIYMALNRPRDAIPDFEQAMSRDERFRSAAENWIRRAKRQLGDQ